jgi:hypothetical protein
MEVQLENAAARRRMGSRWSMGGSDERAEVLGVGLSNARA